VTQRPAGKRSRDPGGRTPRGGRKSRDPGGRGVPKSDALTAADIDPCVGWLRRLKSATWVDPEPRGKAVFIHDGSADAYDVDCAVRFRLTQPKTGVQASAATIVECLGPADSDATRMKMAIAGLGLPHEFPADTLAQAEAFGDVQPDAELKGSQIAPDVTAQRRDLRAQVHVTIDGEDARDFDDAVSAQPEGAGYRIWISIADVASYVQAGTPLDREARLRGTSVYLPGTVLPMLPEKLSNGLCSLQPGVPRRTITCEMLIDRHGARSDISVYPSLIRSAARLTYVQVQRLIDGDEGAVPGQPATVVGHAIAVSKRLRQRRFALGSLDLEIAEAAVVIDAAGVPVDVVARTPVQAHHVIEDLMIAANESVAEHLIERDLAGVYRVHPPPAEEKWIRLQNWGKRFGLSLKMTDRHNPGNMADFVEHLKKTPQAEAGQMLLLRSLAQAYYSSQVAMHFGLASQAYAHFTSPIRRYPDLLVHRALWNHWRDQASLQGLADLAEHCSETERRAVRAERDITQFAGCLVARRHQGEEMSARITGVHPAGLFVRPDELFVEGLIPIASLGQGTGEYFEVWDEAQMMVGRRTGVRYALGEALKVRLARVDIGMRRIDFDLISNTAGTAGGPSKPAQAKSRDGKRTRADRRSGEPSGRRARRSVRRRSKKP
jgi:ribonuclease R